MLAVQYLSMSLTDIILLGRFDKITLYSTEDTRARFG